MLGADFFALFPGLMVRRRFVEEELCARLRLEIRSSELTEATVRKRGSAYAVDRSIRSANWVEVSSSTMSVAESRLMDLLPQVEGHFHLTLAGCQPPQFLSYRVRDFYRVHADCSEAPDAGETAQKRRISVVVFLNNQSEEPRDGCFCGGSLTFYGLLQQQRGVGLPLAGEEGLLIAFPSSLVHEVTPVTSGERYTIACWYY